MVTKYEVLKILRNILILIPIVINISLIAVTDIGLWALLKLINLLTTTDYKEDGE